METVFKLILIGVVNQVLGDGCCKSTMLGGVTYKFIGEEDTSSFSCLDPCTYMKEGEANSKYCFAAGDDGENKCMDSEATAPSAEGDFDNSCVLAGQQYISYIYTRVPANTITTCASLCCTSNYCNYWTYDDTEKGQKYCYLCSQVFGNPTPAAGFSSGLKGCPKLPVDKLPEACLLQNTKYTSPYTAKETVTDYVACQKLCKENLGAFWSFGDANTEGAGTGTCYIYATGESEANKKFISGPLGCPATNGTC